jgi:glycosyltransferase involved in cell wall biosynthesis
MDKVKISFFCANTSQFSTSAIEALKAKYEVDFYEEFTTEDIDLAHKESDLIWWEWAKGGIDYLTSLPRRCPIILRGRAGDILPRLEYACVRERSRYNGGTMSLDSIETYKNLKKIDWRKIDLLLFNAEHIKREFESIYPDIDVRKDTLLCKDFKYVVKREFPKVACILCRVSIEKDLDFAVDGFCDRRLKDWTLIIKGSLPSSESLEWMDRKYYSQLKFKIDKSIMSHNVVFEDWGDSEETFAKSSVILSTSVSEGIANTVMEGMSRGCYPIVRNWIGAEEYYGESKIVNSPEDITSALLEWDGLSEKEKEILSVKTINGVSQDAQKGGEDPCKIYNLVKSIINTGEDDVLFA